MDYCFKFKQNKNCLFFYLLMTKLEKISRSKLYIKDFNYNNQTRFFRLSQRQ